MFDGLVDEFVDPGLDGEVVLGGIDGGQDGHKGKKVFDREGEFGPEDMVIVGGVGDGFDEGAQKGLKFIHLRQYSKLMP